jgi:hypothetical protein
MLNSQDQLVYRVCVEGVTGWSIDRAGAGATHQGTATALYDHHRFSCEVVYGELGLLRLERLPLTVPLCASR